MVKTAFAVVGDQNSGKSSIVRSLTGLGSSKSFGPSRGRIWNVDFSGVTRRCFVCHVALQEIPVSAADYLLEIDKIEIETTIFSLRFNAANGFPDVSGYLAVFLAQGWNTRLALLGKPSVGHSQEIFPSHSATHSHPASNGTAAAIRHAWGID